MKVKELLILNSLPKQRMITESERLSSIRSLA